jgi:hypothetical protein
MVLRPKVKIIFILFLLELQIRISGNAAILLALHLQAQSSET